MGDDVYERRREDLENGHAETSNGASEALKLFVALEPVDLRQKLQGTGDLVERTPWRGSPPGSALSFLPTAAPRDWRFSPWINGCPGRFRRLCAGFGVWLAVRKTTGVSQTTGKV
jgi:hypothetical protein